MIWYLLFKKKKYIYIYIFYFIFQFDLFHTRSNLLCLVCRHVVSFLFAPRCIFYCVRTWRVVWEGHGLSDIATVTKEGWLLQVNWGIFRDKLFLYCSALPILTCWGRCTSQWWLVQTAPWSWDRETRTHHTSDPQTQGCLVHTEGSDSMG